MSYATKKLAEELLLNAVKKFRQVATYYPRLYSRNPAEIHLAMWSQRLLTLKERLHNEYVNNESSSTNEDEEYFERTPVKELIKKRTRTPKRLIPKLEL